MSYPYDFFMYDEIYGKEVEHIPFRLQQILDYYPRPIPCDVLYAAFKHDDEQQTLKMELRKLEASKNQKKKIKSDWNGWNNKNETNMQLEMIQTQKSSESSESSDT